MRTRLRLELFVREISLADIARKAGVDPGFVSRVVAGKQKCSPKLAKALWELGVQLESMGQGKQGKVKRHEVVND